MTVTHLARILRNVRADGESDWAMARNIHLFSIRYADDLTKVNLKELVTLAGVPDSYDREISKGIRLREYVGLTNAAIRILETADRP